MKKALLFFIIVSPAAASAQKLVATHPSITYKVGSEKAYLYQEPADTVSKSRSYLSSGEEAFVVGEFSPRWAIAKRTGALYLISASRLANYNSAAVKVDQAADAAGLPVDPVTNLITYEGVVEVPGMSKADLYTRAYSWIAKVYRSANDVVQMNDKEAGQLVAKGNMRVTARALGMDMDAGIVRHTLNIYVKDGKYKYVLTNLTHEDSRPKAPSIGPLEREDLPFGMSKKAWINMKSGVNRDARRLVGELQTAMTLKGIKDPNDF